MITFRVSLLAVFLVLPGTASAQLIADTLYTWNSYGTAQAQSRVRIFRVPPERYTHIVVLEERADNQGATTVADAQFIAESLARTFAFDPTEVQWIFHWNHASFAGAEPSRKELFLRATFGWTKSRKLTSPRWAVVSREDVEAMTDRQFR